eukprot:GFYU01012272.1.p1 GENE.GFYU01012272.1~~GFYU01012272.1.p1  ORF type:complete len:406 (-),score=46.13 GFYU01012272.1:28-1119(-)
MLDSQLRRNTLVWSVKKMTAEQQADLSKRLCRRATIKDVNELLKPRAAGTALMKPKDEDTFDKFRLNVILVVLLREFIFTSLWAFTGSASHLCGRYLSKLPHFSGYDVHPTTFGKTLYLISSGTFALAGTGSIMNPAVGLAFLVTRQLRARHWLVLIPVQIAAYTAGLTVLKHVVAIIHPPSSSLVGNAPSLNGLDLTTAIGLEFALCFTMMCWSYVSEHFQGYTATMSNVLVSNALIHLGGTLGTNIMNPAAATACAILGQNFQTNIVFWVGPPTGFAIAAVLCSRWAKSHEDVHEEQPTGKHSRGNVEEMVTDPDTGSGMSEQEIDKVAKAAMAAQMAHAKYYETKPMKLGRRAGKETKGD